MITQGRGSFCEIRKLEERDTKLMQVIKETSAILSTQTQININFLTWRLADRYRKKHQAPFFLLKKQLHLVMKHSTSDLIQMMSQVSSSLIKEYLGEILGNNDRKTKVTAKGKSKDVKVHRDILGILVATLYKEKSIVDIIKALPFPPTPAPLSLATADGM